MCLPFRIEEGLEATGVGVDLAAVFVVVERVQKDEVEIVVDVERVSVCVGGEL